jgi:general secretion pathway protein D
MQQADKAEPVQRTAVQNPATEQTVQVPASPRRDTNTAAINPDAEQRADADAHLLHESAVRKELENIRATRARTEARSSSKASHLSTETVTAVEQPVSVQDVNMPLLDGPDIADEKISVNFDGVDIRTVLKTVGDITGINFVVDDRVQGSVTVMSPTTMRLGRVYDVLQSILEVAGYAAVPAGDVVKIVPKADATKRNLQVRIGSDPAQIPTDDSIVTQIMHLRYGDAAEVAQIIQSFLAADSQMDVYPKTNSIVITDTSSNIHHIATVIQRLDVSSSQEQVAVFGLEYASARVLSEQITGIMQKTRVDSVRPGRGANLQTAFKILPDLRTNSLIAIAGAQDIKTISDLVEQLDIRRPSRADNLHVVYLKNAQAEEVAESLTAALANLRITGTFEATQDIQVSADKGTNALVIIAAPQDFEIIAEIIDKLDIVREQVLVEMLIVEVSEDGLKEIGIDWATLDDAVADSVRVFGATNFGPRMNFLSGDAEGLSVGAWKKTNSDVGIAAILHALEKKSGVNILSTPHILTSNHNKAKIIVGENRPFVTKSRITEGDPFTPTVIQTFEYKDVGITLEITPHISQGGLVRLEISSEFTKLLETVTSADVGTPTTAKRQAETNVTMDSGATVVIGGLIRDDKIEVNEKIPLLGDIPVVGGLFGFHREQLQKTNLLIFITPHVMANQRELEDMTQQKKQEMAPALEGAGRQMKDQ